MKTSIIEDEETSSYLRGSGSAAKSPVNSAQTINTNNLLNPPLIFISPPELSYALEQQKLEQGEQLCRVQYNIIIVNHGGNLTIEGAMVNTMIILN